ncbi:MAG: AraC family transcriptional regulator [Fimbriimonadaceae bacterium]|nr:AraC family transcriptional regulator [Chitinophagales bacterium]
MQQPSFDTWTIIFLFAAVHGFFLTVLLGIHKKGNIKANNILALFIGLFSVTLLYYVAYWTGYAKAYPWMNFWVDAIPFLYGPLTFFYIRVLDKKQLPTNYFLHLIPFFLHFILITPLLIRNLFGRVEFLRKYVFSHGALYDKIILAFLVLQCVSMLIYVIVLFRYMRMDKNKLTAYSIPAEFVKHTWMNRVTLFYAVFVFAAISYWLLVGFRLLELKYDYAISFTMSLFIYMVGYSGFSQPAIFNEMPEFAKQQIITADLQIEKAAAKQKYQRSSLKTEDAALLKEKLLLLMKNEKPFLDSALKIQDLAASLKVSTHHLSQIINDMLGLKYSDFINTYRIEEAKKLLSDPAYDAKILSIAFDVGYNNKATFNTAFKKNTGMSPSEYRLQVSKKATA